MNARANKKVVTALAAVASGAIGITTYNYYKVNFFYFILIF
jgi:hypothetical protein